MLDFLKPKTKSGLYELPLISTFVDRREIKRVVFLNCERYGPRVTVHLTSGCSYMIPCDTEEAARGIAREVAEQC